MLKQWSSNDQQVNDGSISPRVITKMSSATGDTFYDVMKRNESYQQPAFEEHDSFFKIEPIPRKKLLLQKLNDNKGIGADKRRKVRNSMRVTLHSTINLDDDDLS